MACLRLYQRCDLLYCFWAGVIEKMTVLTKQALLMCAGVQKFNGALLPIVGQLTLLPGFEPPGMNPHKWQPGREQQLMLAAKLTRLLKANPFDPVSQLWRDRVKPSAEGEYQVPKQAACCHIHLSDTLQRLMRL